MFKLGILILFLSITCVLFLNSQDDRPFIIDFGDEYMSDEQIGTLTRGLNQFQIYLNPLRDIIDKRSELLVNTVNGNVFYRRNDIFVQDAPFPIIASFSYNSKSTFKGRYGNKWQFSYNIQYVSNNYNDNVIIHLCDGKTELFLKNDSIYIPLYGAEGKLQLSDSKLHYKSNSIKQLQIDSPTLIMFDATDHNNVTRIIDILGNSIELEYDSKRLSKVVFPDNRTLKINYHKELLGEIIFNDIYKIQYHYDDNGNLIKAIHPSNEVYIYEYDSVCNLLTKIVFPDGRHILLEYDSNLTVSDLIINDSLNYIFDLDLQYRRFNAKLPNNLSYSFLSDSLFRSIVVTNPSGNISKYQYDINNRLVAIERPGEATTRYFYNENGLVNTKIEPLNRQSSYSYSELGLLVRFVDAENNIWSILRDDQSKIYRFESPSYVYNFNYNESNQLINFSLNESSVDFENDKQRNLLRITLNKEIIYDFRYNEFSKLLSFTKPDRSLYIFDYDNSGNIIEILYPNGSNRRFDYDRSGRITAITERDNTKLSFGYDFGGRINMYSIANSKYNIKYNSLNNFSIYRDSQLLLDFHYGNNFKLNRLLGGYLQSFDYDERDNLIAHKIENSYLKLQKFNLNDELIERNHRGYIQSFRYDKMSRPSSITSPNGRYEYTWDELSNLKQILTPNNVLFGIKYNHFGKPEHFTRQNSAYINYGYDKAGNLKFINKIGANNIIQDFDILGNLTKKTINNLTPINYTYDSRGLIKSIENGLHRIDYTYDNCDRILSITRNGRLFKQYKYNVSGKIDELASSISKINYSYDVYGRLNSITNNGTTHRFNQSSRSFSVMYFNAYNYRYSFNERGLLASITNPENDELRLIYDSDFRLNEIFLDNDNRFKIEYSGGSLISSIIDGADRRFSFNYTNSGRILSITDPNFNSRGIIYDIFGNITTYSLPGNAIMALFYEKDRIDKIIFPNNDSLKYFYDQYGNLISEINEKNNTIFYQYDTYGKLSKVHDNYLTKSIYYDEFMRTSKIVLNQDTLKFSYDDTKVTGLSINDFIFDLHYTNNNLRSILLNSRPLLTLTYDNFGFLSSISNNYGFKESYQNTHQHLVTKVTDFNNSEVSKFYDKLGRLLSIRYFDNTVERFAYTKNGLVESFINRDFSEFFVRYDKNNLPIKFIINRFDSLAFNYNSSGDIIEIAKPSGQSYKLSYNSSGQLTSFIPINLNTIHFFYSKPSNEIKMFTNVGDTTSYGLDLYNRITYKRDQSGRLNNKRYSYSGELMTSSANSDTLYLLQYDKNLRTKQLSNNRSNLRFEYQIKDLAPQTILSKGALFNFTLSGNQLNLYQLNQLNSVINFDAKLLPRKLEFNQLGTYSHFYDRNLNLTEQIDDLLNSNKYQFTAYGDILGFNNNAINISFENDIKLNLFRANSSFFDYSFFYDNNNNLIIAGLPTSFELNFDYDFSDNLKTKTDQSGSINYFEYNTDGKIKKYSNPKLHVKDMTFEYDLARRVEVQQTKSVDSVYETYFFYDYLNRLDQIKFNGMVYLDLKRNQTQKIDTLNFENKIKIISKYDAFNRLVSLDYPNDIIISYEYGIFNKVSKITVSKLSNIQKVFNYDYDNLGRLISVRSDDESTLFKASYTSRHQYKTVEHGNIKRHFTYSGARLTSITVDSINATINYSATTIFPTSIGNYNISATNKGNVTSILNGDHVTIYYYDNENKLIGMLDSTGNYSSFHYNPIGKLIRVISIDTIDFKYIKFKNHSLFYPKIYLNHLTVATNYYHTIFHDNVPIATNIGDTNYYFIEDEFGNRLGYLLNDSIIWEPRFDCFDLHSPHDFIPNRRFIPIPKTNLYYDGNNFFHADLGMFITNNNNKFGHSSPFLDPICKKNLVDSYADKISYKIDSKLIIGGAERYEKQVDMILEGNILSNLITDELNSQFNNFLTFKVKPFIAEPQAKYYLFMPEDVINSFFKSVVNSQNSKSIEILPEGISLLSDSIFQKAYKGKDIGKLINLPKQNSSKFENILEMLKYLDYSDDDQLVRVLTLMLRILKIGYITTPSNVIDISPTNASLGFIDSILKAEDYVNHIISNSQEIQQVQQSIDNALRALEIYNSTLIPHNNEDERTYINILSPVVKNYKPNYTLADNTPDIYYEFMKAQYSNFNRLFKLLSSVNKPFRLLPTMNYNSDIELPIYFDTLDDLNLKNVRPVFKNYFDFLRY